MGLGAQDILAGLVSHDAVVEDEIVLCRDRYAIERGIRRFEPGIEDPDADAGPIDPIVGEWAEMELAIRHLRGPKNRIVAGREAAGVARYEHRCGDTAGDGARVSELEAAQRLDPSQVAVLQQLPERSHGDIGADGVQPTAADADPRPSGG